MHAIEAGSCPCLSCRTVRCLRARERSWKDGILHNSPTPPFEILRAEYFRDLDFRGQIKLRIGEQDQKIRRCDNFHPQGLMKESILGLKAKLVCSIDIFSLCFSVERHGSSDSGLKKVEMATCSCPIERSCADTAKTETATPSIHPRESCTSGAHTFCEFSAGREAGTSKNEARGTVAR